MFAGPNMGYVLLMNLILPCKPGWARGRIQLNFLIMNHKSLFLFVLGIAMVQSLFAFDFNYATPDGASSRWGTEKKDLYDVAVLVKNPALVGMTITGLSVPLDAPGAANVSAWASSSLKLKKVSGVKYNDPDLISQDATVSDGMLNVTFTQPVTITADGVYVGYSFEATVADSEADKLPVATFTSVNDEGFYLHTRRAYVSWESVSEKLGCVSALNVHINGTLPSDYLTIHSIAPAYACYGEPVTLAADLRNSGTEPIVSFSYHYALGGNEGDGDYTFSNPLPALINQPNLTPLTLPAISERGLYDGTLTITKINGKTVQAEPTPLSVRVMTFVPKKRVVMEEYTGFWCGWCVKGFACLEKLNAEFGNDFIAISYHNGDNLALDISYPSSVGGYPAAYLDRGTSITPDYDVAQGPVASLLKKQPVANIEVSATSDGQKITATSTTTFLDDKPNANYRVAYFLIGNGMHDPSWMQSNYLSGKEDYRSTTNEYINKFVDGPSTMTDLVYDDVLIYCREPKGIFGSLPSDIEADSPMNHIHSMPLADAVSFAGESLVRPEATLAVVAVLVDGTTNRIVNGARCAVGDQASVVRPFSNNEEAPATYYDLMGRRVEHPAHGIFVKVQNGKTSKVTK